MHNLRSFVFHYEALKFYGGFMVFLPTFDTRFEDSFKIVNYFYRKVNVNRFIARFSKKSIVNTPKTKFTSLY